MNSLHIPMVETFLQDAEAAAGMSTIDVDRAADLGPMLEAVRTGAVLPPDYMEPAIAKAGRAVDQLTNRTSSDWDETIAEPARVRASEPNEFQRAVIDRLRRFGVDEAEALDLLN